MDSGILRNRIERYAFRAILFVVRALFSQPWLITTTILYRLLSLTQTGLES